MSEPVDLDGANATPSVTPADPKVIKRYTNRKLYDTVESRYVTLDEIGQMVKRGLEVRIVDNKSKDDLTSVTLAQIVFEEEKKKKSRMPLGVLRDIIRSKGETLTEFIQKEVTPRVTSLREGAEASLKLLKRDGTPERPGEIAESTQGVLQEWQRRIDERIHQAVQAMTSIARPTPELQKLTERIEKLERQLAALEGEEKR